MCPFCYIGKRHLEKALENFPQRDKVQITWKSYQLDPDLDAPPGTNIYEYLAERKGISRADSERMHVRVTEMAAEAGLDYRFDKAVVANSFDAHRFLHLAKKHGRQHEAEELIFKNYFTEGKNIADPETLVVAGNSLEIPEAETRSMLGSDLYAADVQKDIEEGISLGLRGVPFFVIDRRYGISGAQPVAAFLQTLEKASREKQD